jgi:hypothetical protein
MHMLKLAVRTAGLRAGDGLALFANGATDVGRSPESFFDVGGLQTAVRHLWTGAPPTSAMVSLMRYPEKRVARCRTTPPL